MGEHFYLFPFFRSERVDWLEREKPFMKEELEPETGDESLGPEKKGQFFEIGAGEIVEKASFFRGKLCAQEIFRDLACGG